jgi:quinohemoprotein ethanol dehydrogenase
VPEDQRARRARLDVGERQRHVLMQANKNGFFYILDRTTGKLISASTFVPVNWASGIDLKTGRPIENPGIRYDQTGKPVRMMPGPMGAHSWQPMAYSPKTGLVYIPAQQIGMEFTPTKNYRPSPMGQDVGVGTASTPGTTDSLLAWDPVAQKERWHVNYLGPWNGGVLTTAGNLVMQGDAAGNFNVYRADSGEKLWSMSAQTAVMGGPVTYEVNGERTKHSLPSAMTREAINHGDVNNSQR